MLFKFFWKKEKRKTSTHTVYWSVDHLFQLSNPRDSECVNEGGCEQRVVGRDAQRQALVMASWLSVKKAGDAEAGRSSALRLQYLSIKTTPVSSIPLLPDPPGFPRIAPTMKAMSWVAASTNLACLWGLVWCLCLVKGRSHPNTGELRLGGAWKFAKRRFNSREGL